MKVLTNISLENGRYNVQITPTFSAAETEKLDKQGEPLIDLGGEFSATASRPQQVNTVLSFGGPGSDAAATVTIDRDGRIVDVTITDGGTGYDTAPEITVTGAGEGAELEATVTDGVVTAIEIIEAGLGYQVTPVTVDFTLSASLRRLRTDAPFRQSFDLNDSVDSDVKAKVWADEVVARMTTAKQNLMDRQASFVGDFMTTV